jgi:hypothetical protein
MPMNAPAAASEKQGSRITDRRCSGAPRRRVRARSGALIPVSASKPRRLRRTSRDKWPSSKEHVSHRTVCVTALAEIGIEGVSYARELVTRRCRSSNRSSTSSGSSQYPRDRKGRRPRDGRSARMTELDPDRPRSSHEHPGRLPWFMLGRAVGVRGFYAAHASYEDLEFAARILAPLKLSPSKFIA